MSESTNRVTAVSSTPGPWMVEPINGGETYQITTSEETGFVVIAETMTGHPVDQANAALIAAAPELLRELKQLVFLLEPLEDILKVPGIAPLDGARLAIAKAMAR